MSQQRALYAWMLKIKKYSMAEWLIDILLWKKTSLGSHFGWMFPQN